MGCVSGEGESRVYEGRERKDVIVGRKRDGRESGEREWV